MLKTKFRLTKCMWYQGTEYERIAETAITEDGERHMVQTDNDGNKYFTIDNPYCDKSDSMRKSFIGYIADSVKAIEEHYADCLMCSNMFSISSSSYPIVMLNRTLGEKYWEKSIEGFKNTKFGFQIRCGNKNSLSGYSPIDSKGNYTLFTPEITEYFTNERDAQERLDNFVSEATKAYGEYKRAVTNEERKTICQKLYDSNIVFHIFMEMVDHPEITDIDKYPNFGFHIEQAVIPLSANSKITN